MKIAFATNDRKTIANRTGRANEFVIYKLVNNEIVDTNFIKNTHEHNHHSEEHSHNHSHDDIVEKLKDIDYLFVKKVGSHLKADLQKAGIKYKLTKEDNIMDVVAKIFDNEIK